jgi:hypothetical protein
MIHRFYLEPILPYVDTVANLWNPAKFSEPMLTAYRTGVNSGCEVAEMSLRMCHLRYGLDDD